MKPSPEQPATGHDEVSGTRGAQIRPELVDMLIELYCDWRMECESVQAAYEHFSGASAPDRGAAFAAYVAALDREQAAGDSYAEQVRLIQARCRGIWVRSPS